MDDDVIVDTATSYADGFFKVMRETGLNSEELEEKLLDLNAEQCPSCRWWCESHELVPNDEPDGHCDNCRPPSDDE